MGLCILPSHRQDPQTLVSCIDFRYITDVLTEEEACGESCPCARSFLVHSDWQPPGREPRCLKEYDAFYFFQKFCGKVKSGKKSEVGCEEIPSLFLLSLCSSAGPCPWGLTSRAPLHPPQTDGWVRTQQPPELLGQSSPRPLPGAGLALGSHCMTGEGLASRTSWRVTGPGVTSSGLGDEDEQGRQNSWILRRQLFSPR